MLWRPGRKQLSTQMLEQTYGHLSPEYRAQEMKKFSFFHPNNGSKPDETLKNIQSQEQPGSPGRAPKTRTLNHNFKVSQITWN